MRAKWIIAGVKVTVTVVLIVVLVRYIEVAKIRQALSNANYYFIVAAILLMPLNLYLQAERWKLLVSSEFEGIKTSRFWVSLLGGFVFGMITPGRVGEIGRVFLLRVKSRLRLSGLHVYDKMLLVMLIGSTGPIALFLMPGFKEALPGSMIPGIGILVTILPFIFIGFVAYPRILKSVLMGIQLVFPAKTRVLEFISAFDKLEVRHTVGAGLLTLVQLFVILSQFYLCTMAFQTVHWVTAAHTYISVLFVKTVLPVSLGSLGIGEWASVSFYQRYDIASETAFSASLLLFAINVMAPALAGLVILLRQKNSVFLYSRSSKGRVAA
ncbi:flippase-like domain-containing protein [bacterium]|nr:flippase-like domain-containing protein [bacterium]